MTLQCEPAAGAIQHLESPLDNRDQAAAAPGEGDGHRQVHRQETVPTINARGRTHRPRRDRREG
jgi:hypothetical protein